MIGSWLIREVLDQGASVVAYIRDPDPQSELYRSGTIKEVAVAHGTLEDYAALERVFGVYEIDTVFHLGAQTIVGVAQRTPITTFEANIRGTYNLLEACRIHRDQVISVVVASSDKAYGERDDLPYREEMALNGRHPYEVSKTCADLIAQTYHQTYETPLGIARCGNVYGGGDLNWSRLIPGTIRSLLRGDRPIIRSDGTYQRDYIYVRDVALALISLAEALPSAGVTGQAFNFSTESPMTVLDVVEKLQAILGRHDLTPDVHNQAHGEIRHQYLSAARARERLGWQPTYGLQRGLEETVAWYRAFLG
jgi:CDP-glucose 4,6-dehydratase